DEDAIQDFLEAVPELPEPESPETAAPVPDEAPAKAAKAKAAKAKASSLSPKSASPKSRPGPDSPTFGSPLLAIHHKLHAAQVKPLDYFKKLDKDLDGRLTPEDLRRCLQSVGYKATAKELRDLLARLDAEKVGSVEIQVLDRAVKLEAAEYEAKLRQELERAMRRAAGMEDALDSPVVHPALVAMLEKIKESQGRISDWFRSFDSDKDGCWSSGDLRAMPSTAADTMPATRSSKISWRCFLRLPRCWTAMEQRHGERQGAGPPRAQGRFGRPGGGGPAGDLGGQSNGDLGGRSAHAGEHGSTVREIGGVRPQDPRCSQLLQGHRQGRQWRPGPLRAPTGLPAPRGGRVGCFAAATLRRFGHRRERQSGSSAEELAELVRGLERPLSAQQRSGSIESTGAALSRRASSSRQRASLSPSPRTAGTPRRRSPFQSPAASRRQSEAREHLPRTREERRSVRSSSPRTSHRGSRGSLTNSPRPRRCQ
ncbi:unnamed protein product, partial [Effrenium voratum]